MDQKKILTFIKNGRQNARVVVTDDERAKMMRHICQLDPYREIDEDIVKKRITEIEKQERYDFERDRHMFPEILPNQFDQIANERQARIKMKAVEAKN